MVRLDLWFIIFIDCRGGVGVRVDLNRFFVVGSNFGECLEELGKRRVFDLRSIYEVRVVGWELMRMEGSERGVRGYFLVFVRAVGDIVMLYGYESFGDLLMR